MNIFSLKNIVVCAAALSAAASYAADPMDLGQLTPNTIYSYDLLVPFMGYYTPEETGIIRCYSTGDEIAAYEDELHQKEIFSTQSFYNADGEKVRIYPAEKDRTIYFFNAAPISEGTFRFTVGMEEIKASNVTPAVSDALMSISTNYSAVIEFNIPVKCTKSVIECNGVSEEIAPNVVDSSVTVSWMSTIRQWYRDGKINEGDVLTLTLSGIRDANNSANRPDFGDGLGKLVLKYKMAGRPAELIREVGTPSAGMTDLLTYYLPDGSEGVVSLIFSGKLDPNCHPTAELQYGDIDNLETGIYVEHPPVSISDNTLSVDLRGVSRFPDQMIPGLPAQSNIGLRISSVKGADGQYVLTGISSSPYSFGYSYRLKSVVYSLAADWLPLSGSPLEEGTQMEIWVLGGTHIKFDSVDFSYVKDGADAMISVPYSALRVESDPYEAEARLYYLAAPAIDADPDSEIAVSFGGLKCADGLDHSSDILAHYKAAVSGVGIVGASEEEAVYFDLTGRRVLHPAKGIYIRAGRKVVVD